MNERLLIYFNGDHVGVVDNFTTNMWYMEGLWLPAANVKGRNFTQLLEGENVKDNFRRGDGILVEYRMYESGAPHDGLVMGLLDGNIVVRMLSAASAEQIRSNKNTAT